LNTKNYYLTLIALLISFIVFNLFIKSKIIGGNSALTIYVYTLPTFVGLLILLKFKSVELKSIFTKATSIWEGMIYIGFAGIILLLYSYLSFGFFSILILESSNQLYAKDLNTTTVICDITKVNKGRRSNFVAIIFQEEPERIGMSYEKISYLKNVNDLAKYSVKLTLTPGLLNTYIVEEVAIINN
jgi:hypothetical protein